jgi:hypothetical protein
VDNYGPRIPLCVTPGLSRSKNGVAEPVIGPATSGRTRWLAYDRTVHAAARPHGLPDQVRQ